jgi:hypothetical protein
MVPDLRPGIEGCGRDDQENEEGDPEAEPEIKDGMGIEQLNELGKRCLRDYTTKTRTGMKLRQPTHAETQSIKKGQELACYVHQTINPLYRRFLQCDYLAKEGAMEYCWHLIRKKVRQLCSIREPLYGPKRALTPEQTAVKLMANTKAHLEWDLLQTTDFVMEELNWRVIHNRMKGQQMSAHDALVLEIERGRHLDRLYKGITKLMHSVPEPIDEERRSAAGLEDEPPEERHPKTPEGLARLLKQKEERKEELAVATYLNWANPDPNIVEKVLVENWERTEVGGELWQQCEKLRELILGGRMPRWAEDDRRRMEESSEAIAARGDWHLDPGTTYHRKVKKRPHPKCPVPVEEAEKHFRSVWDPRETPEGMFKWPEPDSVWTIPQPAENEVDLDGRFAEWMRNEDDIRACLKSKHNLSALGLDGIGYLHLKFGGDPIIKSLSLIFGDCVAETKVPQTWKSSRTVLLYKKGSEMEMKNWRPISITCCVYRLFTAMMTKWIQDQHSANKLQVFSRSQKGFAQRQAGCMEHAVLTREMISHATLHHKNLYMAQIDFSNAFGRVPHELILYNMYLMGLPFATVELVRDIYTDN